MFLKSQVFTNSKWSFPHKTCTSLKRWQSLEWATRRSRPRWACQSRQRSGGCRGCARMARWCRGTWGDHVARRLFCVLFSLCSAHITRNVFCMLYGHHCSKTSASIWHGPRRKQRPEAHEVGALASEAGDVWESCVLPLYILILWPSHR